ncbi:hypothetical protein L208DRAFT_187626 [Tricholoma matsutake]|nr:hypothetical protein L208DRAFT_187626 [Tricholoma matsutake 945]
MKEKKTYYRPKRHLLGLFCHHMGHLCLLCLPRVPLLSHPGHCCHCFCFGCVVPLSSSWELSLSLSPLLLCLRHDCCCPPMFLAVLAIILVVLVWCWVRVVVVVHT